ncbi:hypothetical protein MWU61_12485 [Loktanella sp. F6476L]|nr:hypothetical protein [Loktanella sp. F6476L]MCK0121363.1 hypothetical protein [Loktanella sp. F6476L]
MHAITTNEATRKIIERAHAERNAAIRAFFVAMFTRKPNTAAGVAPQAA